MVYHKHIQYYKVIHLTLPTTVLCITLNLTYINIREDILPPALVYLPKIKYCWKRKNTAIYSTRYYEPQYNTMFCCFNVKIYSSFISRLNIRGGSPGNKGNSKNILQFPYLIKVLYEHRYWADFKVAFQAFDNEKNIKLVKILQGVTVQIIYLSIYICLSTDIHHIPYIYILCVGMWVRVIFKWMEFAFKLRK